MQRKLKVGLIGASANGGWGPVAHIPALKALKEFELAALCTSRPDSAKAASEAFGVERSYHSIRELVAQHDLDIISVVVKIPSHYEAVKAVLEAGKHVYCEWPLGASLHETEELTNLAIKKGLVTAIGLQGHHAPEFLYIKQLLQQGWFGKVVNVKMTMHTKASSERASKKAWEDEKHRKASLFSIAGGHTLYYLSHVFGSIREVAGQLRTQYRELTLKDSGEKVENTIPDQVSIHGILNNDIPFSSKISAVPHHPNGWRLEISGTEGTMLATSSMLPQITPIQLLGSKDDSELKPIELPEPLLGPENLPEGPARNVGRNYASLAEAIVNRSEFHPNFNDALKTHQLLHAIQQSSGKLKSF